MSQKVVKCNWCGNSLSKEQISRKGKYCSCSYSCSVSHRNTTPGGKCRSEEFKRTISKVIKGKNNPMYERKHSEETKKH